MMNHRHICGPIWMQGARYDSSLCIARSVSDVGAMGSQKADIVSCSHHNLNMGIHVGFAFCESVHHWLIAVLFVPVGAKDVPVDCKCAKATVPLQHRLYVCVGSSQDNELVGVQVSGPLILMGHSASKVVVGLQLLAHARKVLDVYVEPIEVAKLELVGIVVQVYLIKTNPKVVIEPLVQVWAFVLDDGT